MTINASFIGNLEVPPTSLLRPLGPFFGFSHSRLYFSWILLSRPLLVLSLYWAALVLVYGCNCRRRVSATRIEVLEDWHLRQFPRCRFLYWLCCDRVCLNKSCHIHSRYGFIVINCRSSCWHVCHVVTAYALHIDARDLFACSSKEQQMMIHTAIDN